MAYAFNPHCTPGLLDFRSNLVPIFHRRHVELAALLRRLSYPVTGGILQFACTAGETGQELPSYSLAAVSISNCPYGATVAHFSTSFIAAAPSAFVE